MSKSKKKLGLSLTSSVEELVSRLVAAPPSERDRVRKFVKPWLQRRAGRNGKASASSGVVEREEAAEGEGKREGKGVKVRVDKREEAKAKASAKGKGKGSGRSAKGSEKGECEHSDHGVGEERHPKEEGRGEQDRTVDASGRDSLSENFDDDSTASSESANNTALNTPRMEAGMESGMELSFDDMMALWRGFMYDVWMADKALKTREVCVEVCSLSRSTVLSTPAAHLDFIAAFFCELQNQWDALDQYRLDKFSFLVRVMTAELIFQMKARAWEPNFVTSLAHIFLSCSPIITALSNKAKAGTVTESTIIGVRDLKGGSELEERIGLFLKPHAARGMYLQFLECFGEEWTKLEASASVTAQALETLVAFVLRIASASTADEATIRVIFKKSLPPLLDVLDPTESKETGAKELLSQHGLSDNEDFRERLIGAIDEAAATPNARKLVRDLAAQTLKSLKGGVQIDSDASDTY